MAEGLLGRFARCAAAGQTAGPVRPAGGPVAALVLAALVARGGQQADLRAAHAWGKEGQRREGRRASA